VSVARHLDKIGVPGSIVAALCCLGVSALVSVATALGLGFLLNDAVLLPLFLLFLALSLWGLAAGWRRHRNPAALALGVAAGAVLFVFAFVRPSTPWAYGGVAGLVIASAWNVWLARRWRSRHG
jgi:mercuric ion transport protein